MKNNMKTMIALITVCIALAGCCTTGAGPNINENGPVTKVVDKNGNSTTVYWSSENVTKR